MREHRQAHPAAAIEARTTLRKERYRATKGAPKPLMQGHSPRASFVKAKREGVNRSDRAWWQLDGGVVQQPIPLVRFATDANLAGRHCGYRAETLISRLVRACGKPCRCLHFKVVDE